jgi:predicted ester cyclase
MTVLDSMLGCFDIGWTMDSGACIDRYLVEGSAHQEGRHAGRLQAVHASPFGIDESLAMGDRVFVRWHLRGTWNGDFGGVEATAARIDVDGATFASVRGDRVLDTWNLFDRFTLLRQLGSSTPNR